MQSRLSDINTAVITYRREAINSLKSKKYDSCFGSLYSLNSLLPSEYRVNISTSEFIKRTVQETMVVCGSCKAEINYNELKIFDRLLPFDIFVFSDSEVEKVWECSFCKKVNQLTKTKMYQNVLKEPYFIQVVPEPPQRKDGLNDRFTYHRKVSRWVWLFINELESQWAKFRDDHWHRGGDEYFEEDSGMGSTGEDQDV